MALEFGAETPVITNNNNSNQRVTEAAIRDYLMAASVFLCDSLV